MFLSSEENSYSYCLGLRSLPLNPKPSRRKGKGKGKPFASRARDNTQAEAAYRRLAHQRWEAGDTRVSRTTALRGRQRAPKHVRRAAALAAMQGGQAPTDQAQDAPAQAAPAQAAAASNRAPHHGQTSSPKSLNLEPYSPNLAYSC